MPLKILPKKKYATESLSNYWSFYGIYFFSWHVLARKNVERVKRDEAAAEQEQQRKTERSELAVSSHVFRAT